MKVWRNKNNTDDILFVTIEDVKPNYTKNVITIGPDFKGITKIPTVFGTNLKEYPLSKLSDRFFKDIINVIFESKLINEIK